MSASRILRVETPLKPIAFAGRKPCRIPGPIGQIKIGDEGQQDRGQRLNDEKPLPSCKAARPMKAEERRRDGRSDRGRERNSSHETADDPGAVGGRKPKRQKEDDAGEESGLSEPEKKAKSVERVLRAKARPRRDLRNKGHRSRYDAPRNHDSRDPDSRADPVHDDVRGNLEQKIGQEENPRAESERGV